MIILEIILPRPWQNVFKGDHFATAVAKWLKNIDGLPFATAMANGKVGTSQMHYVL